MHKLISSTSTTTYSTQLYSYIECAPVLAMATRDHFFEKILDVKPSLDELCEHIRLGTKWYEFGVLLKLDVKELEAIDQEPNKRPERKALQMFQLWLDTTANATRRQVIDTLRREVIGEVVLADNYIKAIREREDPDSKYNV